MPRSPVIAFLALTGCVSGIHQERVARVAPRPQPPVAVLTAYAKPADAYPSVGGDILKGASPEEQAAARAAAEREAVTKP